MGNNLLQLIEHLVEDVLRDPDSGGVTVYFDMDGVLAAFDKSVLSNRAVSQAKQEFQSLLKLKPEFEDLHMDDFKSIFKGEQADPTMAKLKKAWNKYRNLSYSIASRPGHFKNLEMLPGAREMLVRAAELTGKLPKILTAPMESSPTCEEEKREWVEEKLAGLYSDFHCTQDKHLHAKSENDILIDDRPKYVNKFKAAGGTAILHTDPSKSMKELEEIVKTLSSESTELDEFNAMSTGAVVGYTLPLGMKPDYKTLGTDGKKKKRPRRWYDVRKEAVENSNTFSIAIRTDDGSKIASAVVKHAGGIAYLDEVWVKSEHRNKGIGKRLYHLANKEAKKRYGINLTSSDFQTDDSRRVWSSFERDGVAQKVGDRHRMSDSIDEEFIGKKGGVSYFQIGGSLPDKLYNRTNDGKPTRDPGVAGLSRPKKKKKKK